MTKRHMSIIKHYPTTKRHGWAPVKVTSTLHLCFEDEHGDIWLNTKQGRVGRYYGMTPEMLDDLVERGEYEHVLVDGVFPTGATW